MSSKVAKSLYRHPDPAARKIIRDWLAALIPSVDLDMRLAKKVAKLVPDDKQAEQVAYYQYAIKYLRFLLAQQKPDKSEVPDNSPPIPEEFPDGRPAA